MIYGKDWFQLTCCHFLKKFKTAQSRVIPTPRVIVFGVNVLNRFIPLLGYALVQIWPSHVAPSEDEEDGN